VDVGPQAGRDRQGAGADGGLSCICSVPAFTVVAGPSQSAS
jgi:hypothetical protein